MGNYRDLKVWRKALDLCLEVYELSGQLPASERFGLREQLRRSAVSIPSNIAEGQGRGGDREFRRFVRIALGSLLELETQILISWRLGYCDREDARKLATRTSELGKMLNGLSSHLTTDD